MKSCIMVYILTTRTKIMTSQKYITIAQMQKMKKRLELLLDEVKVYRIDQEFKQTMIDKYEQDIEDNNLAIEWLRTL